MMKAYTITLTPRPLAELTLLQAVMTVLCRRVQIVREACERWRVR